MTHPLSLFNARLPSPGGQASRHKKVRQHPHLPSRVPTGLVSHNWRETIGSYQKYLVQFSTCTTKSCSNTQHWRGCCFA